MAGGGGGSLMKAAADVAWSVIGPQAADDVRAKRQAVCAGCELRTDTKYGATCGLFSPGGRGGEAAKVEGCGCFLDVKIRGEGNACPRGLW